MVKIKNIKILIIIFIIILVSTLMFGCMECGFNKEKYLDAIPNITASTKTNSFNYPSNILIDEINFNDEIKDKSYYKIKMNLNKDCEVKAVAFSLRSSTTCNLTFELYENLNLLKTKDIYLTKDKQKDLNFTFEEFIKINKNDNFYFKINCENDYSFSFDNFLVFFKEY